MAAGGSGPLFMGVDLGSQSLKLFIIDEHLEPVTEANVQFDADLPQYLTQNGFHRGEGGRVTCPTLLWAEALERCFSQLLASGAPLDRVVAVSGSAQQHGSVYWRRGALARLQDLNPGRSLVEQIGDAFAVSSSPVWMDSSTKAQCEQLEDLMGGALRVAHITGSKAYERFTGNQIAKLLADDPDSMRECERVCLISSFLASLLIGGYAPIDASDGSGMNLLDIKRRAWSADAVAAVASSWPRKGTFNLGSRLGGVAESYQDVGLISPYWSTRFKLPTSCAVIAFSGDNNNSLVGLKLKAADIAVSLGTSDTIFATLHDVTPGKIGHIFAHPILQTHYMAMLCYSNGSLTREVVRDHVIGKRKGAWDEFDEAIARSPVGNKGNVGFYFHVPEIAPQGGHGIRRFSADDEEVDSFDKDTEVRALVESQFLRMRLHSTGLGLAVAPESRIFVTGGASRSKALLQVLADVFGCPVYRDTKGAVNAAAFGAALRAAHGWELQRHGGSGEESGKVYARMLARQETAEQVLAPNPEATKVYSAMLDRYARLEQRVMGTSKPWARPGSNVVSKL
eukprot:TRINITY_DN13696_c0_g1_i1.p1 TRINITY_DN13696_c0_g1~~TRINITY_DN13696_c0_g1_i1.p1  ORF type:complete len:567 (+),score=149.64 TRINITY_DN13696_c0_g1_i1:145-1845(+)